MLFSIKIEHSFIKPHKLFIYLLNKFNSTHYESKITICKNIFLIYQIDPLTDQEDIMLTLKGYFLAAF